MGSVHDEGTEGAGFTPYGASDPAFAAELTELVADHDDALLTAIVEDPSAVPYTRLRGGLAAQTARTLRAPGVLRFGDHGRGRGRVDGGDRGLLPATAGDVDAPVSGTVFKVERGRAGEKIAYVRMFSGTVRTRDRLRFGDDDERKVTGIDVFDRGSAVQRPSVVAGQIGKLRGLGDSGSATRSATRRTARTNTISPRRRSRPWSFRAAARTPGPCTSRSRSSRSRIR